MPSRKRVLITGGAGFIGSHVANSFAAQNYEVIVVDNLSTGCRENLAEGSFFEIDLTTDAFKRFVVAEEFDVVCHLAAQIDVRASVDDPNADATANIFGTLNLMEGLRNSPKKPRVVFSSTGGAVYGLPPAFPTPESSPKDPDSPYAVSKLAAEYYLSYYRRIHQIESVILRFGNVYGPRQSLRGEAGVVAIFCKHLLTNSVLTVFGDGHQTRDYVYVLDIARAVLRAAEMPLPPVGGLDSCAFNLGTGKGTSVLELISLLRRVSGIEAPIVFAAIRPGELRHSVLSREKVAMHPLQWNPTALQDGLSDTFAWFSAQHNAEVTRSIHSDASH